jgi:hypothetical protein
MKKILLALVFVCLSVTVAFGAGTTTPAGQAVRDYSRYGGPAMDGYVLTITATADASDGSFVPILITDGTDYEDMYRSILGKWLTSVRTVPDMVTPPTANYDIYILEGAIPTGEYVLSSPTLAIGSDTSAVASAAFSYIINGSAYSRAVEATGTEPGNDVIVATKYGAVAFDIGANGTIDVIEATNQAAAEFTTAALAVAALPACASDHVRLGHITATKSDGAFTFGTTALNDGSSTVVYRSAIPVYDITNGKLVNRSATAAELVFMTNSGAEEHAFISDPIMVVIVNNSVNSAVVTMKLIFN